MGQLRKPFQGIVNIIRFNWHFYIMAIVLIAILLVLANYTNSTFKLFINTSCFLLFLTIFISLLVSYYVYDLSGFYNFNWIPNDTQKISILNINAGFDETSELLIAKFKNSDFLALDFYNSKKHTEISIKRARKAYPPYSNTMHINSSKIELANSSVDKIFVILSAHEIRNIEERIHFFKELNRILKPKGTLIVIEHLRDFANFMAYTIGAFHFYSKASWLNTFHKANLKMTKQIKNTAFISTFILEKNGNTL